jgi:lipase maturation factor 1
MDWKPTAVVHWLFASQQGSREHFLPRWLFLRALGLIYFSAFFSLIFQVRGLIGPAGILPAKQYLEAVATQAGQARYWYAPTLLWVSTGSPMLMGLCWAGLVASVLVTLNLWSRGMLLVCFVCFLSFVGGASEFAGYQSDGMLLEAGVISLFFAPPGLRPGLGRAHPVMRASMFLLLWEWFRIYFESGVAKLASGDPEWRHFTAMDEYYQNGPLPTWIGWYVQHLPHWFHAATAFGTLALELVLVWMLFLPRRWRIVCFFIVTPWQVGVILTANYTFLNYLVLTLAFLLLDDRFLKRFVPRQWKDCLPQEEVATEEAEQAPFKAESILASRAEAAATGHAEGEAERNGTRTCREWLRRGMAFVKLRVAVIFLLWLFYASTAQLIRMILPELSPPWAPVAALDPLRVADRYGLFAWMTRGRYEIEFQGSVDGQNWVTYPFQFKPQDPSKAPGIYAPYQPRFDWNLWFASLGAWRANPLVTSTEVRLLDGDADVLALFAGNPFSRQPPRQVRAVIWQYWFTSAAEKRATGRWWDRQMLGLYAPTLERQADGRISVVEWPTAMGARE